MSEEAVTIKGFEVRPVREENGACEVATDTAKASFWTLYARLSDGIAEALEDFSDGLAAREAAAYYRRCESCAHLVETLDGWRCQASDNEVVSRVRHCPEGLNPVMPESPEPSDRIVAVATATNGCYRADAVAPGAVSSGMYKSFAPVLTKRQAEWRMKNQEADRAFFWVPTHAPEGKPQWVAFGLDADDGAEILALAAQAKAKSLDHVAFSVETTDCDKGDAVTNTIVLVTERWFRFVGEFAGGGAWESRPFQLEAIRDAFRHDILPAGFSGSRCPACESEDIEGGSVDTGAVHAFQEMWCMRCGASWTNRYDIFGSLGVEKKQA